ncbi:hypothetical protein ABZ863_11120 [Saccharomonospora sp. NPDC046836]|uniref:hypothetical protein n=1 Tax=Saccharomonospora sp. NPDC046836 TaxID=3156921 RepID=UPI003401AC65
MPTTRQLPARLTLAGLAASALLTAAVSSCSTAPAYAISNAPGIGHAVTPPQLAASQPDATMAPAAATPADPSPSPLYRP